LQQALINAGHASFYDETGNFWVSRSPRGPHGEEKKKTTTVDILAMQKDSRGVVLAANKQWLRPFALHVTVREKLKELRVRDSKGTTTSLGDARFIIRGHKNFFLTPMSAKWLEDFIRSNSRIGYLCTSSDWTLPPPIFALERTVRTGSLSVFMLTHDTNMAPCTDHGQLSMAMCKVVVRESIPQFCLAYSHQFKHGQMHETWNYLFEVEHTFNVVTYQQHADVLRRRRSDMQYIVSRNI
jgi:hypothetical protein